MKLTVQLTPIAPLSTPSLLFPGSMFLLSICVHVLVISGILHSFKLATRPPQVHAVIIDLILSEHGASPDDKTQSEPKQKASIAESALPAPPPKNTPYQPVSKPIVKPDNPIKPHLDRAAKQTEQIDATGMVQLEKPTPAPPPAAIKTLTSTTSTQIEKINNIIQPEKPLDTKPPTAKPANKPVERSVVKQIAKKPFRKTAPERTTKKQKPKPVKRVGRHKPRRLASAAPGSGRKHRGRTRTGITQGASHIGAGLSNPRPPYPVKARSNGYQGRVWLVVIVNRRGHTRSVRLHKSSGFAILDKAALKTVKKWRFRPALKNGIPVKARVILPINFRLKG